MNDTETRQEASNPIDVPLTLMDVLEKYDKIEIPVIQRGFAQGRESRKAIRERFLKYILESLAKSKNTELDFVYGYSQPYEQAGVKKRAFVPVDGQQRLTTLWLLHWLLALKSGRGKELAEKLDKFTYETRPSSKTFLKKLCNDGLKIPPQKIAVGLKEYIENLAWFDDEWRLDQSIEGFLVMLEAIAAHPVLANTPADKLLESLLERKLISFYFLELKNFELGEEIYTRMNARGKTLTDFETFKSRLYKITGEHDMHNILAEKIEGEWTDHLWEYKIDYLVDEPFLNYFRFITTMLVYGLQGKALENKLDIDFLDDVALSQVYPQKLEFLIHAFDMLPTLKNLAPDISFYWWTERGLKECLQSILEGTYDSTAYVCVFAALLFLEKYPCASGAMPKGINDFLREIRNLIGNTPDAGERELPEFISSLKKLLKAGEKEFNIYNALLKASSLSGFRVSQRQEEIFKAQLITLHPQADQLIKSMDENRTLKAKIAPLILQVCQPQELAACLDDAWGMEIIDKIYERYQKVDASQVDLQDVENFFHAYEATEKYQDVEWFDGVWGDLLPTSMYIFDKWVYCGTGLPNHFLCMHPEIYILVQQVCNAKKARCSYAEAATNAIAKIQKSFIRNMSRQYKDLSKCEDPQQQLYLLYIYNCRCANYSIWDFFKDGRFNFGWLPKETGYTTPFPHLDDGEEKLSNQIFQAYPKVFQAHGGIKEYRTPDVLMANKHPNFSECLMEYENTK